MKKKIASISFLLLIVAFLTISVQPFAASASEVDKADTEAGIGFNTNEDEPTLPSTNPSEEPKLEPKPKTEPEKPTQPSNVRTPSVTNVRSQSRIYRRLPQTNMQQQFLLTLAGILLVALFLIVVTHRDRKRVEANE